jgi:hypothetical protein
LARESKRYKYRSCSGENAVRAHVVSHKVPVSNAHAETDVDQRGNVSAEPDLQKMARNQAVAPCSWNRNASPHAGLRVRTHLPHVGGLVRHNLGGCYSCCAVVRGEEGRRVPCAGFTVARVRQVSKLGPVASPALSPYELRRSLLHKCLCRFAVVLGERAVDVVGGF